jgi:hypothetical protein
MLYRASVRAKQQENRAVPGIGFGPGESPVWPREEEGLGRAVGASWAARDLGRGVGEKKLDLG